MATNASRRKFLLHSTATVAILGNQPPLLHNEFGAPLRGTEELFDDIPDEHTITNIHQILITDKSTTPKNLNINISNNSDILRRLHPSASYKLWSKDDIRDIISMNFDREILKSFDNLQPYAFKADLARYCILYVYGGLYLDLGVTPLCPWKIPRDYGFAGFQVIERKRVSWLEVSASFLWATAGRLEFKKTIERIGENCKNRFMGRSPSQITASPQLGRSAAELALARAVRGSGSDQWIGQKIQVLFDGHPRWAFLDPKGKMLAVRRNDPGGDWTSIATEGTNNYREMWLKKQVYSSESLTQILNETSKSNGGG